MADGKVTKINNMKTVVYVEAINSGVVSGGRGKSNGDVVVEDEMTVVNVST
jgi:hypothetical protein